MNTILEFVQPYGFGFPVLGVMIALVGLLFAFYQAAHKRILRALRAQLQQRDDEVKVSRESNDALQPLVAQLDEAKKQLDGQNERKGGVK